MKGVILAGGKGTRLHPLTRITNKHLLPIYDRPMVTYAIEALVHAGVDELMLVTGGTHAGEFFRLLGNGHAVRDRPRSRTPTRSGRAGSRRRSGSRSGSSAGDRVVVMLADNVFERSLRAGGRELRAPGARRADPALARGGPEHLRHLGVAELDGDRPRRADRREARASRRATSP